MAFLDSSHPDIFGPEAQVEEEPYLYGFVWSYTTRTNQVLRVVWAINATGSEAPPATWTVGADTYRLLSTSVDRGYGVPLGKYTAIYRLDGTWTPVAP
jgi:hypothetical protein